MSQSTREPTRQPSWPQREFGLAFGVLACCKHAEHPHSERAA